MSVEYLNLAPMEFGQKAQPRKMLRTGPIVDVPVASDPLYRHMSVTKLRKHVRTLRKAVAPATSKMDRPALVKELANLDAAVKAQNAVEGADMITKAQDKMTMELKSRLRAQKVKMINAASNKKADEEKEAKKAEKAAKKVATAAAKAAKAEAKAAKVEAKAMKAAVKAVTPADKAAVKKAAKDSFERTNTSKAAISSAMKAADKAFMAAGKAEDAVKKASAAVEKAKQSKSTSAAKMIEKAEKVLAKKTAILDAMIEKSLDKQSAVDLLKDISKMKAPVAKHAAAADKIEHVGDFTSGKLSKAPKKAAEKKVSVAAKPEKEQKKQSEKKQSVRLPYM
jgi:hypothetical protein